MVGILTDQPDSRHAAKYWSVLKVRLKNEGSELTTNCSQLKFKAADGKRRLTDVAGNARKDLESHLGRPVITINNAYQLNRIITQMIVTSIKVSGSDKPDEE